MFDNSLHICLALFGGYLLTSIVLLKNPTLLHKRKKIKFTCRHISHRGGAGESYENTISAFRRAIAIGSEMLELDCQLTKDNKVVVLHDSNLLRCSGLDINVSDINYGDLPLLHSVLPVDFDPGVNYVGSGLEEERKIPLLYDVFRQFPDTPMNIDVKKNNQILIKEVNRLISEFHREDITVWGNSSDAITSNCYVTNPRVNLLFSMKRVVQLVLLFYSGLLPFFSLKETHLEVFQPYMYLHNSWRTNKIKDGGHFMVYWPSFLVHSADFLLLNPILINHLRKRGIHIYIWVINDETQFKKLFDLGVTGIMTDYPTKLRIFLNHHPEYDVRKRSDGANSENESPSSLVDK